MITQLMRVRNAFLPAKDKHAYGYIVGKKQYRGEDRLVIAWEKRGLIQGHPEVLTAHSGNVIQVTPYVFLTNECKPQ